MLDYETFNYKGDLNGIFRHEWNESNLIVKSSSLNTHDGYNYAFYLFNDNDDSNFVSEDIPNSSFTVTLRNDKTFIIDSYTMKGDFEPNDRQLTKWKFEGQLLTGEWIILDEQMNSPLVSNEVRNIPISCKEKLIAVRVVSMGPQLCGHNNFHLGRFDIFGKLCPRQIIEQKREIEQLKEKNKELEEHILRLEHRLEIIETQINGFG